MESVLSAVLTSPGVMGGMITDDSGRVLVRSLPGMFDPDNVAEALAALVEQQIGLDDATGGVRLSEIRFELGKVVSRPVGERNIVLVCENSANIQILSIALNVASKKLEKLQQTKPESRETPQSSTSANSATLPSDSRPKELTSPLRADTGWTFMPLQVANGKMLLRIRIIEKSGGTFWDSMEETVSVNRATCRSIWRHYNSRPSKKFSLKNHNSGQSTIAPLNVIEDDRECLYDGQALITLAVAEHLQLLDGELVEVDVPTGTGIFGWEGI